jgi:porin
MATFLAAVFNGDPAGPCPGDPDTCNRYGTNFRVHDPAFMIGEAQLRFNQGEKDRGLATTLKIGGWNHLGQFNDRRYADNGLLLADPASGGVPMRQRGDWGIYGVIDQQLYRPASGDARSGISFYTRASASPSDRNLVSMEIDSGFVFAGLVPQRPHDRFGVGMIYSRFSNGVRAFDQDQINFGTGPGFVRDYELNIEFTYLAQVLPGWTMQPVFTLIQHSNGEPGRDAKVAGVRSIWKF